MTEITTTGKTVAEAVELACETLGISSSDAVYEIIEEARGGFLGIGAKLAKVHVWLREDEISGISLLEEMARPRSAAPAPQVKVTAPTPQQMRHDDAPRRSEPTPQPARPASPSLKPEIKAFVETAVEEVEIPENGLPDSAKTSLEYLRGMTKRLGAEKIEFKAIKTEKGVCFVLDGDDASLIIGRRGETMDA
ncbi:MAG: Jag N-terminal domain-containing protein, partial [Oscillospiraceae bacterium]